MLADHGSPIEPVQHGARADNRACGATGEDQLSRLAPENSSRRTLFSIGMIGRRQQQQSSATKFFEDCFPKQLFLAGMLPCSSVSGEGYRDLH